MDSPPTPDLKTSTSNLPDARKPAADSARQQSSPIAILMQRYHARINAAVGLLMLVLAVLAPLIAPADERGQVVIITVIFGITGALMLYAAVNTSHAPTAPRTEPLPVRRFSSRQSAAREILLRRQIQQARFRAMAGFIVGVLIMVAGAIAPFLLAEGETNPDARFLMVIGFSPVAISGALLVLIFVRALGLRKWFTRPVNTQAISRTPNDIRPESMAGTFATVSVASGVVFSLCAVVLPFIISVNLRASIAGTCAFMGALGVGLSLIGAWLLQRDARAPVDGQQDHTALASSPRLARRAPVPRIPASTLYRIVVPTAIVLMLALIVIVILVVVAATITPLVR